MVDIIPIEADFAVAGQIGPGDVATLAAQGFRAVINNRPDGEALFGQAPAAKIDAAAAVAGIASHYLPVTLAALDADLVRRFHAATSAADGPVLAYCKSGFRSALIWAIAGAACGGRPLDELMRLCAAAGQDLSGQQALIDRLVADTATR